MAGKVQRIWLLELTLIRDEFAELLSTLLAAMGRRNNHNQFPSAALVSACWLRACERTIHGRGSLTGTLQQRNGHLERETHSDVTLICVMWSEP